MRVDFYMVGEHKTPENIITILANKAYQAGWRIGIHSHDASLLNILDQQLWQQPANSFMPHTVIKSSRCQSCEEPIMLFNQAPDDIDSLDYYINFTHKLSDYKNENGRLADIILFNESSRVAGRERYTHYKQQECELNYHEL